MTQDHDITTLHFLEEIQRAFANARSDSSDETPSYDTRRIVNFFDNTAALQIIDAEEVQSLNGSAKPVATISLQCVAKDEDLPTFTVKISDPLSDKAQKMLILVHDHKSLKTESNRLVKLLENTITKAKETAEAKAAAEAQQAQAAAQPAPEPEAPAAPAPEAAPEPADEPASPAREGRERRSSSTEGSSSLRERPSRRSRLRSRDTGE